MVKNYTQQISEFSYSTQYPDYEKFGFPVEKNIYVGQRCGEISIGGNTLRSEGFAQCSALIIRNSQTLESTLFHIDDWYLNFRQTQMVDKIVRNYIGDLGQSKDEKLNALVSAATRYWNLENFGDRSYPAAEREYLKSRMKELNNSGVLRARYIRGDESRDLGEILFTELLSSLGFERTVEIFVNTGQSRWDVGFKPKEAVVLVTAKKQKKILSYHF